MTINYDNMKVAIFLLKDRVEISSVSYLIDVVISWYHDAKKNLRRGEIIDLKGGWGGRVKRERILVAVVIWNERCAQRSQS